MISKEDTRHVAKLARLELTEEEVDKFSRQLGDILGYVEQMNEIDTTGVEPMAHPFDVVNVMREDEVVYKNTKEELIYNNSIYQNQLFVEVYTEIHGLGYLTLGDNLYKKINTEFITKNDIIKYKPFIPGYYADLDYADKLDLDTKIDYEDDIDFDKHIISSEPEYREKQGRFITYEEDCIYRSIKKKK